LSIKYNQAKYEHELIATALEWCEEGASIALVTLVSIEGNAPYPIGSQMLVKQDGDYIGQITGGCAEAAIADQAVLAIQCEQNKTVRYGLNSPYFDIQLPCGSGIDVYFQVNLTSQSLKEIDSRLRNRQEVKQVLNTEFGEFTKVYLPKPRLTLAGQGPILLSLAQLAVLSGFDVACIAQNKATETNLETSGFYVISIDDAELNRELDSYSAFVSLFHEHDYEANLLVQALQSDAFYIGALGSKKTHSALA